MIEVILALTRFEAKELADYLTGDDTHLSYGDRLSLARKLRWQIDRPED